MKPDKIVKLYDSHGVFSKIFFLNRLIILRWDPGLDRPAVTMVSVRLKAKPLSGFY